MYKVYGSPTSAEHILILFHGSYYIQVYNIYVYIIGTMKPYLLGELTVSKCTYVAESITISTIASIVIDSATYLLTINSPDMDNAAMSLYDIIHTYPYTDSPTCCLILTLWWNMSEVISLNRLLTLLMSH